MGAQDRGRVELKKNLLAEGAVSQDILNDALCKQERSRGSLLDILIETGKLDEKRFVGMLRKTYAYTVVNLDTIQIDPEILSKIPQVVAEKYWVLPLSELEQTLTVVFANPTNLKAIDELRNLTGMRIKSVIAEPSKIKHYVKQYYAQAKAQENAASPEFDDNIDDLVKMIEVEKEEEGGEAPSDLIKVASETPVIKLVNMLMTEGIRRHASDIFIEPWEKFVRVRARVDGLLEEIIRPNKTLGPALVSRIKIMSELNIAEHRIPQDGRFKIKMQKREVDMRVSILPTTHGEKVCLRILDTSAQGHDISKLGFNDREQEIIKDSARKPHGMILVTGPTGSGKTTTLYSVLKYLHNPTLNISTVEDPVEYQIPGINQVNVKDNIGLTFPAALRSLLRQDPDIILIGEIRDNDTLDIAVKAALTGHLVLSTLHTNDAASAVTRMINMGLEPFLIASTVLMISGQRLVRRLCQRCRVEDPISEDAMIQLGVDPVSNPVFYRGKGCGQCRQSGYAGRSVITEILQITPEIRELVMLAADSDEIKLRGHSLGMTTLRECAVRKALEGETSVEEIFRVTSEDQGLESKEEKGTAKGSTKRKKAA